MQGKLTNQLAFASDHGHRHFWLCRKRSIKQLLWIYKYFGVWGSAPRVKKDEII